VFVLCKNFSIHVCSYLSINPINSLFDLVIWSIFSSSALFVSSYFLFLLLFSKFSILSSAADWTRRFCTRQCSFNSRMDWLSKLSKLLANNFISFKFNSSLIYSSLCCVKSMAWEVVCATNGLFRTNFNCPLSMASFRCFSISISLW